MVVEVLECEIKSREEDLYALHTRKTHRWILVVGEVIDSPQMLNGRM